MKPFWNRILDLIKRSGSLAGLSSVVLGGVVMLGWLADYEVLIRIHSDFPLMQFNTALCFFMAGLGLSMALRGKSGIAYVFGAVLPIFCLVTLSQFVFSFNAGLDELFVKHKGIVGTEKHPGRMAPGTAMAFILAGLGILTIASRRKTTLLILSGFFGAMEASLGGASLLGYMLNLNFYMSWGPFTSMAVHTSAGHLILGIGIIIESIRSSGLRSLGAPSRIMAFSVVSLLIMTLFIWNAVKRSEEDSLLRAVTAETHWLSSKFQDGFREHEKALERMALRWEVQGGTPYRLWQADARAYAEDLSGFHSLFLANADAKILWKTASNRLVQNSLLDNPVLRKARDSGKIVISDLTSLSNGKSIFFLARALQTRKRVTGYLIAAFDAEHFFHRITRDIHSRGFLISISYNNKNIYQRRFTKETPRRESHLVQERRLVLGEREWKLILTPASRFKNTYRTNMPLVILFSGVLSTLLTGIGILLWMKNLQRARFLEDSNLSLIQAREEAIQANKSKSLFLSNMSHELRTPMNAIMGFAQLLEIDETLNERQKDYVLEIIQAGDHLMSLINELLDLTKIESGRVELVMDNVLLDELLFECLSLVQPLADKKSILLELEDAANITLEADRIRLKQALLNLLSNALKYNREGGSVRIYTERDLEKESAKIIIQDTGPGIPKNKISELFTPFNRLGVENQGIEGAAIGLALSRKLIRMMGGELSAESVEGRGSTFFIELPLKSHIAADSAPG